MSDAKRPRVDVVPKWTEVTYFKESSTSELVPVKLPQQWAEAGKLLISP